MARKEAIRALYNQVSEDGSTPLHVVTSGEVLNELLITQEFEPAALYSISAGGIWRVENAEDDHGS